MRSVAQNLFYSLALCSLNVSCVRADRCGDGTLDAGEHCDDGNETNGDGCSTSCEPDNDLQIPGDERAGYFVCKPAPDTPGVTCEPGNVCCLTDGPVCVRSAQECPDVYNVASCDGPEDCERAGDHCETESHGTYCSSSEGSLTWCHRDADCRHITPWLPDGTCTANGTCFFAPPDSLLDDGR